LISLDIGCGRRKIGTINVDIDRKYRPDIICDIHYLPFRNRQFELVYCLHVLEHKGVNPIKAIKELLRINNGIVQIQIPHWLSSNARKDKTHVNFQVMKRKFWIQFKPLLITLDYTPFIPFIPFFNRPNNITVQLTEATPKSR